jgi:hypothetical protein
VLVLVSPVPVSPRDSLVVATAWVRAKLSAGQRSLIQVNAHPLLEMKEIVMRIVTCLTLIAGSALAQSAQPFEMPRMPNGKPNLQGVWQHPYVPDMTANRPDQKGAGELPYTAWGANDFKNYDVSKFDYTGHCLPMGLMRSMNAPYPIQIMQNDAYLAFLFEQSTWFNVVYLDGRRHPADPNPTWFGHSVGKWDGDTLVIDTVGFNDKTRLDTLGHPHSDELHMIQRFVLRDATHMDYEVTIDDQKTYTRPWRNSRVYTRMKPGEELIEYSCEENNKDFFDGHIK